MVDIPYLVYFFLFLFGLIVGSFLNVLSLRYKPGARLFDNKVIGGRSFCLGCGKKLLWCELVPIFSFIRQKGKCRSCGKKLLWQYPLVELLCGLIFVGVPWRLLPGHELIIPYQFLIAAIWIIIFLLFLLLSIIDFRHYIIPDQINWGLIILGLVLIGLTIFYGKFDNILSPFLGSYALLFGFRENIFANYLLALLFGILFFGAIIVLSRERAMGWGDFKLVIAMGIIFGWPDILMVLFSSFIIGTTASLILICEGKKGLKDAVPFGPFLALGGATTFFFGSQIMEMYFKLFSI